MGVCATGPSEGLGRRVHIVLYPAEDHLSRLPATSGSSVYVMKLCLGSNLRRHLLVRCGAPATNVTEASVMLRFSKEPPRQKVSRLVVVTMKLKEG